MTQDSIKTKIEEGNLLAKILSAEDESMSYVPNDRNLWKHTGRYDNIDTIKMQYTRKITIGGGSEQFLC